MEKRLPQNMTACWQIGSKSFVEIYSNPIGSGNQRTDEWREAPLGKQIGEDVCRLLFYKALELARQSPDRHIGYVRYDIEGTPETENNRPFREGAMEKTIVYEGYTYKAKL
jgi:hypothetical protein